MCDTRYEVCECDQAHYLREAIERAYAEICVSPNAADAILKEALDTDHKCTVDYLENIK
jgi:hypothetical protein